MQVRNFLDAIRPRSKSDAQHGEAMGHASIDCGRVKHSLITTGRAISVPEPIVMVSNSWFIII